MKRFAAVLAVGLRPVPLLADTPDPVLERHAELAKMEDPGFAGFLPEHGHELYLRKRVLPVVGAINCACCHMADPREEIIAHKSMVLCRQCQVIASQGCQAAQDPAACAVSQSETTDQFRSRRGISQAELRNGNRAQMHNWEDGDIIAWPISVK